MQARRTDVRHEYLMHWHGCGGSDREKRRDESCDRARGAEQKCRADCEQESDAKIDKDVEVSERVAEDDREGGYVYGWERIDRGAR